MAAARDRIHQRMRGVFTAMLPLVQRCVSNPTTPRMGELTTVNHELQNHVRDTMAALAIEQSFAEMLRCILVWLMGQMTSPDELSATNASIKKHAAAAGVPYIPMTIRRADGAMPATAKHKCFTVAVRGGGCLGCLSHGRNG